MEVEDIHETCREKEFHAYGTARLFEARAKKIKDRRTIINFLGIINPILLGCVVVTFGVNASWLPVLFIVAGVISAIQLAFSIWAMVARWDEVYDFSVNSIKENTELTNTFKELQKTKSGDLENLYKSTMEKNQRRETSDLTQSIDAKEKRFANREALRHYQLPCYICNNIPKSEKPTRCDGCGNF
ncbi:mobilome CxxCx(11)CxxC protein [Vibrio harveyi]|uniref:mobilome CxxCx(11)CxxC protein n=1 Tax=Vibrio harveyi TaxID=669 RepID=UPI003BB68726